MNRKIFLAAMLLALLLLFAACAGRSAEGDTEGDVPLLWRATSPAGNSIYLFGSIHAATPDIYPLPRFIMDAFNRSDYLAVEIDMLHEPSIEEAVAMLIPLMYDDDRSVVDDIGWELRQRADSIFAQYGMPWFGDMFKPAMWWVALTQLAVDLAGWSAEYGIDMYFMRRAAARNMPILEVESAESQTQMMANFSMPLQIALLEDIVMAFEDIDSGIYEEVDLLDMWLRGDYNMILQASNEEYSRLGQTLAAEYHNAMMTQRDIHMTQVAREYMAAGMNVFFMVGLMHFIVEGGIIDLLEEGGYTVERIK